MKILVTGGAGFIGSNFIHFMLAQYPDVDAALMLNCMLLAATEGIAAGDGVSANYHYSWFRALSAPQPSQWDPQK